MAYLIYHQTTKLVEEGTVKSTLTFPVSTTTKDLDQKFQDALVSMPLDTEDKLVQKITWKGKRHLPT